MKTSLRAAVFLLVMAIGANVHAQEPDKRPPRLRVTLTDGSWILGAPALTSVNVRASLGPVSVRFDQVESVKLQEDKETFAFAMRNGDRISGVPDLKSLKLGTILGEVEIDIRHVTSIRPADGGANRSGKLLLWNRLGSAREIQASEAGPPATIYGVGILFVPGRFGSGFTSGDGKSGPNFGAWEKINPGYDRAGAVEFWWKPARASDEDGPPDEVFVSGTRDDPRAVPFHLAYRWKEDQSGAGGFTLRMRAEDGKERRLHTGKQAAFRAGDWVHVAFAWSMTGLPNDETARYGMFVNGNYLKLAGRGGGDAVMNWNMAKKSGAYFAMGYCDADADIQLQGTLDNVKVWDFPKVDFSDRNAEAAGAANLVKVSPTDQ